MATIQDEFSVIMEGVPSDIHFRHVKEALITFSSVHLIDFWFSDSRNHRNRLHITVPLHEYQTRLRYFQSIPIRTSNGIIDCSLIHSSNASSNNGDTATISHQKMTLPPQLPPRLPPQHLSPPPPKPPPPPDDTQISNNTRATITELIDQTIAVPRMPHVPTFKTEKDYISDTATTTTTATIPTDNRKRSLTMMEDTDTLPPCLVGNVGLSHLSMAQNGVPKHFQSRPGSAPQRNINPMHQLRAYQMNIGGVSGRYNRQRCEILGKIQNLLVGNPAIIDAVIVNRSLSHKFHLTMKPNLSSMTLDGIEQYIHILLDDANHHVTSTQLKHLPAISHSLLHQPHIKKLDALIRSFNEKMDAYQRQLQMPPAVAVAADVSQSQSQSRPTLESTIQQAMDLKKRSLNQLCNIVATPNK